MKKKTSFLGLGSVVLSWFFASTSLWAAGADAPTSGSLVAPERVVASSFGFAADDSTKFLQKAIDSGAKTVVVDRRKSPWIVRPLTLRSNLELVLEEGVEIVAKRGDFLSKGAALMKAANVENLTIRGEGTGATLRMRKREYWSEPYEKSEWRHGLSILSSSNVRIENLQIAETGGDGIYLGVATRGVPCRDVSIKKVDCVENNRQGVSVIGVDGLLMEDCVLRDTNGTAPESGIDFEPNLPDEQISRVVLRNVVAENNAGDGFQFYLANLEARGAELTVELVDCRAVHNERNGFWLTTGNGPKKTLPGKISVENCDFIGNRRGVFVRSKSSQGAPLFLKNVRITTPSADSTLPDANASWRETTDVSGFVVASALSDVETVGGIEFDGLEIVADSASSVSLWNVRDESGEGVGVENVCGTFRTIRGGKTVETKVDAAKIRELFPNLTARRVPAFDFARLNGAGSAGSAGSETSEADAATSAELAAAWREAFAKRKNPKPIRVRNGGTYRFFATSGDVVSFSLRQFRVGKSELGVGTVVATSPNGETTKLADLPASDVPTKYEWTAKETGWQTISVENGAHSFELSDASTPILATARPKLNAISTTGDFSFYVPNGSDDLGVRIAADSAERVTATLFDPNGNEVWRGENVDSSTVWTTKIDEKTGAPIPPQPGFWTLRFEKPTVAILEDFSVLILGVPALLR